MAEEGAKHQYQCREDDKIAGSGDIKAQSMPERSQARGERHTIRHAEIVEHEENLLRNKNEQECHKQAEKRTKTHGNHLLFNELMGGGTSV